jgi:hypothetical protein
MTTETDTIFNAARAAFDGERPPSFLLPEFKTLLAAVRAIVRSTPQNDAACAHLGRQLMGLILEHRQAAMITERHIAISRDASRPPQ